MRSTENVKLGLKARREKAGLTLEALATRIGYSVAAVNGLENNGTGSARLRERVLDALATPMTRLAGERATAGERCDQAERTELTLALERARLAEDQLARVQALVGEILQILKSDVGAQEKALCFSPARKRLRAEPERTPLRDIATISLPIFGTIPAGWPQNLDPARSADRYAEVPAGRFPEGAFGLDVRGDSMNAAAGGPILDGETVILVSREQREPRHHDIVAALCDGQSTLKRLQCPPGKECVLRAESSNPEFAGDIVPVHELTIQGVVVGKLQGAARFG